MKLGSVLNVGLNIAVVCVVLYLLFRPGGSARSAIEQRRAKARERVQVESAWPRLTAVGARVDGGTGPVALIEFSDYECNYCEEQHRHLRSFLAANPDVGVVYRHFPLSKHAASRGAALTSICAEAQGAFPLMHAHLFEHTEWRADTNWTRAASEAGVPDTTTFRRCLADPETERRLEEDLALARNLGVTATPTFAYRGGLAVGVLTDSVLRELAQDTRPAER